MKISSGDQSEGVLRTRPRRIILNNGIKALTYFSARKFAKEYISSCGILEREDNAVLPDTLHAAINDIFDIGRLQNFSKRHRVDHTAGRSFDPPATNDKGISVIIIILQATYAFSWRASRKGKTCRQEIIRAYVEMRERWNIVHTSFVFLFISSSEQNIVIASETVTNEAGEGVANEGGGTFIGGWPVASGESSILDSECLSQKINNNRDIREVQEQVISKIERFHDRADHSRSIVDRHPHQSRDLTTPPTWRILPSQNTLKIKLYTQALWNPHPLSFLLKKTSKISAFLDKGTDKKIRMRFYPLYCPKFYRQNQRDHYTNMYI
ncbi:hypothetical protein EVAR_85759_1 [Eumeta japonica]|uniref:Uncharacterized protein n=1 Tax=Eumeta variegata TaxID=151549 RepID=A0A4C1ZDH7_EUMVA|nr:hypothetical protein EVAR_85759_1 [Eumeta japonica]